MASMMAASGMTSSMRLSSAYAGVSQQPWPCACACARALTRTTTTTKWSGVQMETSRPTKSSIRCAATDDKINPPTQKNEEKEEGQRGRSVTKVGLREAMAFAGPAPETINGRLAMVGFASAMAVEIASGQDVFSQINNGGGAWFVACSAILSVASLVPLLRGGQTDSSQSLFSANAETWNGRFAMLGLVALAITEHLKGGPLV